MISPDQLRAIEYALRHGDLVISGIKELRHSFEPAMRGIKESKDLYEEARRNVQLAKNLLGVYGEKNAPGELAARIDCKREEAIKIIDMIIASTPKNEAIENWNEKGAVKWLRDYAARLASEAKYIRSNAVEWGSNEDEFRCGLANGLGIEGEEQEEVIREIHAQSSAANRRKL